MNMKSMIWLIAALIALIPLGACDDDAETDGDADGDSDGDADGDSDGDADGDSDGDADGDSDGDADGDSDGDADGDSDGDADGDAPWECAPLPAPTGSTVTVTPDDIGEINGILDGMSAGDTLLFADGTYDLHGAYIYVTTPGVTLRSASGNAEAVVIDGNYETTDIVSVRASDVTVAELTLQRSRNHPIHVHPTSESGDITGTLIYRVRIIDPGQQAIKINPNGEPLHYPDDGVIACTTMLLTDEGRAMVPGLTDGFPCYTGGVDAHQARDWVIRDNWIEGFWCESGNSEHGIHFWRGCRDPIVERNTLLDNHRAIGFGLVTSGEARTYDDTPCPDYDGYIDHYGGVIRNNFIAAARSELWSSGSSVDCGICLWSACGSVAVHNTVATTQAPFSSIEWRFAGTSVDLHNNLVTHNLREREDVTTSRAGNVESAPASLFVDIASGDLHLTGDTSSAVDQGVSLEAGLCDDDVDGQSRDDSPDVGADEVGG